jgi:hypothetical protein
MRALKLLPVEHVVCMGHGLDCAVKAAFKRSANDPPPNANGVCDRLRDCYHTFQNSPQRTALLLNAQPEDTARTPRKKLLRDVPTRWNSKLFMLRRAKALKNALTVALTAITDSDIDPLPSAAWRLIDEVIATLTPVEQLSRHSEGSLYVTSSVVPIRYALLQREIAAVDLKEPAARTFRSYLLEELRNRDNLFLTNSTLLKAACLDPRRKDLWFIDTDPTASAELRAAGVAAKAAIRSEFAQFIADETASRAAAAPPVAAPAAAAADPKHPLLIEPPILPPAAPPITSEIDRWFDMKTEPRIPFLPMESSTPPLAWWTANAHRFPQLYRFSKRYLAIQASAAPVERIWSHAGRLVNRRRARLSADTIAEQVFLYENRELCK